MPRLLCEAQLSRMILIISNMTLLLLGFAVMGLGIYIIVDGNFNAIHAVYSVTEALGGVGMQWMGAILIVVGIFTTALALFGCLGAGCNKRTVLCFYAVILTLIIAVEFVAVILILNFRRDIWTSYDTGFEKLFQDAYLNHQTDTIAIIEKLEVEFQCCGVNTYSDYTDLAYRIPASCYPNQIQTGVPFNQGCATAVTLWTWNELPIIAAVLGGILFLEIFGVVTSLILSVAISHASIADVYDDDDDDE